MLDFHILDLQLVFSDLHVSLDFTSYELISLIKFQLAENCLLIQNHIRV